MKLKSVNGVQGNEFRFFIHYAASILKPTPSHSLLMSLQQPHNWRDYPPFSTWELSGVVGVSQRHISVIDLKCQRAQSEIAG